MKKCVVKKQIMHEQYKQALFGKKQLWHGMKILRSEGHEIYGMYVNKISLSPFDSKRWICDDGINTKAYGYEPAFKFTDAEIAVIAAAEEELRRFPLNVRAVSAKIKLPKKYLQHCHILRTDKKNSSLLLLSS